MAGMVPATLFPAPLAVTVKVGVAESKEEIVLRFHWGQEGVWDRTAVPRLVSVVSHDIGIVAAGQPGSCWPSQTVLTVICVTPGAGSLAEVTVMGPKETEHVGLHVAPLATVTGAALPTVIWTLVSLFDVALQLPPTATVMLPSSVPTELSRA